MFELDIAARVDSGPVRKTNQDMARVSARLGLALVVDGGGEHGRGFGYLAAEAVADAYERLNGPGARVGETRARLLDAIREANARIREHRMAHVEQSSPAVALLAAAISHNHLVLGGVGSCRCYRLRNGSLEIVTRRHSYGAELQRFNLAATPEGREALERWSQSPTTHCLDGRRELVLDERVFRCEPGDVYLLCTDGAWGSIAADVIAAILGAASDAEVACERLVGAAWASGGTDNIAVAVMRMLPLQIRLGEGPWISHPADSGDQLAGDTRSSSSKYPAQTARSPRLRRRRYELRRFGQKPWRFRGKLR